MEASWEILNQHLEDFERKFGVVGRQPRDKDWRPVCFAVRDVITAWVVNRLQAKDNVIEVDVFMTENPSGIPGWSGTKFATVYLLSQAFKSGSSMGIRFTQNVESGHVPTMLATMAEEYGVTLSDEHIDKGVITPKVARHLYLALMEFSPEMVHKIQELSVQDKISPERICYMVAHGTYTKEEMKSILLGSENPEDILLGKITPEEYLLYQDVVLRARDALLGGFLDRKLLLKEVFDEHGNAIDLEGNDRYLTIEFDSRYFAKFYLTGEDTPVPWTIHRDWVIAAGERMLVLVRARDTADFQYYFELDLKALEAMKQAYSNEPTHFFLLVPRNILDLPVEDLEHYRKILDDHQVTLMICPESVQLLDQDVMRRLRESETMRHDVGHGEERGMEPRPNAFDFNTTQLRLVALPSDLVIGRLSLAKLLEQAIYDEDELHRGVNKHGVRARYHLVGDRLRFLAHQALLEGCESILVSPSVFPALSWLNRKVPGHVRSMRLLPIFWTPEQSQSFQDNLKALPEELAAFKQMTQFLQEASQGDQVVIVVQDKHGIQSRTETKVVVFDDKLVQAFSGQFVPDWINDYGDIDFKEVVIKLLWRAVNSARRGQANSVNLAEVPHAIITQALHSMVYENPNKVDGHEVAVNVIYTDGSQARPFPLFSLKPRNSEEMKALRELKPIRIGMISQRHPEMDSIIQRYWFRNIEVSQPGMTSAEVDELCYQKTLRQLGDIYTLNKPVRMAFYQTGFQAPLVGFWRAVVEFLKLGQGRAPVLEIIPYFYDKRNRDNQYERGDRWH